MKTISRYEVTIPVTFNFNSTTNPLNDWTDVEKTAVELFKSIYKDRLQKIGLKTDEDRYTIHRVKTYLTPEVIKENEEREKRMKEELGF